MSEHDTRTALADAASTITGVKVQPYFNQSTKAGDGYVRMDVVNYPDSFGGVVTWQVCVILPQNIAAAEKWLATNGLALAEALNGPPPLMQVRNYRPVQLVLDGSTVPAVVIEGINEQE